MTVSHVKTQIRFYFILVFLAVSAGSVAAQTPASSANDAGRDASFLPPPGMQSVPPVPPAATSAPVAITAPQPIAPQPAVATPPAQVTLPPVTLPVAQPPVIVPPPSAAPSTVPATALPASTAAPAVVAPVPTAIAKPVETAPIGNIDPESIGLITKAEGDLGADVWKGTPRLLATKLFQALNLPTASRILNNLAHRLLLTTASVPEGPSDSGPSFTSLRIEKLLMLGDAANAWKLMMLGKPDQTDEITLRLVAEAALISTARDDVCAKLPDIVKTHNGVEWQKLMLVCQLRANDQKAAQLTLDLLHAQNVKDDIFFFVAEKNIMGSNKQLPRQMTPLKPLTLALLRLTDLPLPGEVYVHPDAALIPELLAAKAREDVARIGLAERAGERGLISGADLATVYRTTVFAPDVIANVNASPESGPRLRALLYQAALQEKSQAARMADVAKYMQSAGPALENGAGAQAMADMIGDPAAASENNAVSALIAHVYVLAGKNEAALEWVKQAKHAAIGMPPVAAELNNFWPLTVLAGLESDTDYAAELTKWLDGFLKNVDPKNDARARRDQAAAILLLLDADGFAVSNEAWAKVIDMPANEKRVLPSALFFERLRSASTSPRRGETILLALDMAGNGSDIATLSAIEIVHALRLTGLTADAALYARETAHLILTPKP